MSSSLERIPEEKLYGMLSPLAELLEETGQDFLTALHKDGILLTQICSNEQAEAVWETVYEKLAVHFPAFCFYLCIGSLCPLAEYPKSLESANKSLQKLFFCPQETHLVYPYSFVHIDENSRTEVDTKPFAEQIRKGDVDAARKTAEDLTDQCIYHLHLPPMRIVDLYNDFFHILYRMTLPEPEQKAMISARELLYESIFCFRIRQQLSAEIAACFSNVYKIHSRLSLEEVKAYIQEHYADPELSLEQVSKHFFMSTTWFCIHFKENTGKTFVHYLTEYRIRCAEQMLAHTNRKSSDIAQDCGFNDSNYFSKIFKKETGMTPKEFRKKLLAKES